MKSSRVRRARATVYVSAAALSSVLAVPAVASATVTTTTVDAPAPDTVLEGDSLLFGAPLPGGPDSTFTASGTAPGADPGDLVDLTCTITVYGQVSAFPLADDVPVGDGGRFSADAAIPPYTCRVRAVPDGLADGQPLTDEALDAFSGPRVLGGSYSPLSDVASDDDAPQPGSYLGSRGQRKGFSIGFGVGAASLVGGGPFDAGGGILTSGLVDGTELRPVLGGVGLLARYESAPTAARAPDPAEAPIVVDGRPAVGGMVVGDEHARVVSHVLDPITGDLRIVESVPVGLLPDDDSSDLQPSGITLERTFEQDHDGRLLTFHDVFRSTDGAAHQVEVRYAEGGGEAGLNPETAPAYRVPWETGDAYVEVPDEGSDFGPAPAGPATIYVRTPRAAPQEPLRAARAEADAGTDEGAYAFDSAPSDGAFLGPQLFTVRFVRDVPAGGSATVSHRYAQAPTLGEVDDLLRDDQAAPDPGGVATPLPASTPLPQKPPVLPPVVIPGVTNPLPRVASSTKKLLLTRAQGARLRDRKPVTVRVKGVPAGRYGITVQRFVRHGKALARGTKTLTKDGDLAVTLRLTVYGREYFGLKRTRERAGVRTLVKVTWTPPGKGRKSRTGVFKTRFR